MPRRIRALGTRSPSPHGEGGLKSRKRKHLQRWKPSLPTRGGWIEMSTQRRVSPCLYSPSPHGEGGLKCLYIHNSYQYR